MKRSVTKRYRISGRILPVRRKAGSHTRRAKTAIIRRMKRSKRSATVSRATFRIIMQRVWRMERRPQSAIAAKLPIRERTRALRSAITGPKSGRRTATRIGTSARAATRSTTRQTIAAAPRRALLLQSVRSAVLSTAILRSTSMWRMRRNSISFLRQRVPQRQPTIRAALSAAKPEKRSLSMASLLAMSMVSPNGRGKVIRLQRQHLLVPAAAVTSKL